MSVEISVIIPVFNIGDRIRDCLDSLRKQTFQNWEAIIIDDGSTDGTYQYLERYLKKDLRFKIIQKKNEGTLLARQSGFLASRGKYIANLDHDDKYSPHFLEEMFLAIETTGADFVYCKRSGELQVQSKEIAWSSDPAKNCELALNWDGITLLLWDKLIRREIFEKIFYPRKHIVLGEDPIQGIQIIFYSKKCYFVNESLYYHTPNGASSDSNREGYLRSVIELEKVLNNLFMQKGGIPENVVEAFSKRYIILALYAFYSLKKDKQKYYDTILNYKNITKVRYQDLKGKNRFYFLIVQLGNLGIFYPARLSEKAIQLSKSSLKLLKRKR